MNKKIKIAYLVLSAINAVICIVDIIIARYAGAILSGISVLYLIGCYLLINLVAEQDKLIETCLSEINDDLRLLKESAQREALATRELNVMRKRAEAAERKLKELQDNTPARGKDGRYIKRNNL